MGGGGDSPASEQRQRALPSQLHNAMHPRASRRTCSARDPVNTRVPMGTSNEMAVTVSHPAKVGEIYIVVGALFFPGRDDTGPSGLPPPSSPFPVAFVNTSNMLPLGERQR